VLMMMMMMNLRDYDELLDRSLLSTSTFVDKGYQTISALSSLEVQSKSLEIRGNSFHSAFFFG